jgi:hypothetical protein
VAVSDGSRDDRVLPETRWASLVVFVILVPAFVILWGFPAHTSDLWAWTIKPDLTPIFLGAGYGAGAYFFWRTFRATHWHPSAPGVIGAAVFAALMLLATLIHWDRFNHGDAPFLAAFAFYAWVGVYIISPFVVGWLWWRNQRTDAGLALASDAIVPPRVRLGARLFAAGAFAAATVFFVRPSIAIDLWPWHLTPLTARVLASFTAQVGVGAFFLSRDQRWSTWRLLVQTFFVATALQLAGAIRAFGDFDRGNPMTWLYLLGLVAADAALLLLYRNMSRQAASAEFGAGRLGDQRSSPHLSGAD